MELVKTIFSFILYQIFDTLWVLQLFYYLIKEIITPIVLLIMHLSRFLISVVKLIFYLPTVSFLKLFSVIKDAFLMLLILIKGFFSWLSILKRIIIPAAKTTIENKETTFNIIQIVT